MSKTKKRKAYTCGGCGQTGHNKRTCPSKATVVKTEKVPEVTAPVETEDAADATPAAPEGQFPLDGTSDLTEGRRTGSSDRPKVPAAPYECPTCNQVAVLVLVELLDGKTALRCEKCRNSTPIKTILKWGALPKDKPVEAWRRRSLI